MTPADENDPPFEHASQRFPLQSTEQLDAQGRGEGGGRGSTYCVQTQWRHQQRPWPGQLSLRGVVHLEGHPWLAEQRQLPGHQPALRPLLADQRPSLPDQPPHQHLHGCDEISPKGCLKTPPGSLSRL